MNLADALVPRSYTNGELIIKQGESADGMYFVEDGQIQITILGENGREVEVQWSKEHVVLIIKEEQLNNLNKIILGESYQ